MTTPTHCCGTCLYYENHHDDHGEFGPGTGLCVWAKRNLPHVYLFQKPALTKADCGEQCPVYRPQYRYLEDPEP